MRKDTCSKCGGLEGYTETIEDNHVAEVHFCHDCGKAWFRHYRGPAGELGRLDQQTGAGGQDGCETDRPDD